jgi:hypothetical protein
VLSGEEHNDAILTTLLKSSVSVHCVSNIWQAGNSTSAHRDMSADKVNMNVAFTANCRHRLHVGVYLCKPLSTNMLKTACRTMTPEK